MGLVSFILSLIALLLTIIAFIPLFGWLNWLFIPFSLITLALNVIFRNLNIGFVNLAKAGTAIALVSIIVGILRLVLFGGIF